MLVTFMCIFFSSSFPSCVISLSFALCYVFLTCESKCSLAQVAENGFHFRVHSLKSVCVCVCACGWVWAKHRSALFLLLVRSAFVLIYVGLVALYIWFVFMAVLTNIKQSTVPLVYILLGPPLNDKLCTNASYVEFYRNRKFTLNIIWVLVQCDVVDDCQLYWRISHMQRPHCVNALTQSWRCMYHVLPNSGRKENQKQHFGYEFCISLRQSKRVMFGNVVK